MSRSSVILSSLAVWSFVRAAFAGGPFFESSGPNGVHAVIRVEAFFIEGVYLPDSSRQKLSFNEFDAFAGGGGFGSGSGFGGNHHSVLHTIIFSFFFL